MAVVLILPRWRRAARRKERTCEKYNQVCIKFNVICVSNPTMSCVDVGAGSMIFPAAQNARYRLIAASRYPAFRAARMRLTAVELALELIPRASRNASKPPSTMTPASYTSSRDRVEYTSSTSPSGEKSLMNATIQLTSDFFFARDFSLDAHSRGTSVYHENRTSQRYAT